MVFVYTWVFSPLVSRWPNPLPNCNKTLTRGGGESIHYCWSSYVEVRRVIISPQPRLALHNGYTEIKTDMERLILFVLLAFASSPVAQAASCTLDSLIANLPSLVGAIVDDSQTPRMATILDHNVVCLAASTSRGEYREASVAVNCTGFRCPTSGMWYSKMGVVVCIFSYYGDTWDGEEVNKLVVCLSTNGERALNYTIVKRLIFNNN